MKEEAVIEAVNGAAAGTFNVTKMVDVLDEAVQGAVVGVETASPASADFQVELESLVDLYNTLSKLHDAMLAHIQKMEQRVINYSDQKVVGGGSAQASWVSGVNKAWTAVAESAGAGGVTTNSFLMNLKEVDSLLVSHMAAALATVSSYAQHENLVVERLGHAATAAGSM